MPNSNLIKTFDINFTNVSIANRGTNGCYYVQHTSLQSQIPSFRKIIGIFILGWTGASASITPYIQNGTICFMSDISQTVTTLDIRLIYLS